MPKTAWSPCNHLRPPFATQLRKPQVSSLDLPCSPSINCLILFSSTMFYTYMSWCRTQLSHLFTRWTRSHVSSTQSALDSTARSQCSLAKCPMWSVLIHLWPVSCTSLHHLLHPSAPCRPSLSGRTRRSCHPSPHRPSVSEVPIWVRHFSKYNSTIHHMVTPTSSCSCAQGKRARR